RSYPRLGSRVGSLALPLLEEAVQAAPEDVPAWEARGSTLWLLGRQREALTAFEAALAKAPQREEALPYAGVLAAAEGRADAAPAGNGGSTPFLGRRLRIDLLQGLAGHLTDRRILIAHRLAEGGEGRFRIRPEPAEGLNRHQAHDRVRVLEQLGDVRDGRLRRR